MLRLVCLLLVPLAYSSVLRNNCQVTEWSNWTECLSQANCPAPKSASWKGHTTNPALADARRAVNMAKKEMQRASIEACKAAGTCNAFNVPDSVWEYQECVDGFAGEWPCDNVDLITFINLHDLGYTEPLNNEWETGADIWGWRDEEFQEDYVVMATAAGCSFVRVTDPQNAVVLAFLRSHTVSSLWRDVKVLDHYMYTGSEASGHGIQVFDMHKLRDMDSWWGYLEVEGVDYLHYDGVGQSHNVAVNEDTNMLFVVGSRYGNFDHCSGGLHMVDVSDPSNPSQVGCFDEDGYTHDTQCVIYHGPDTRYQNREICFSYNEDSLTIADVENKNNPVQLSRMEYENSEYTHQGWLTENHEVLLLDDELDELADPTGDMRTRTFLWDIKDLNNPVLMTVYWSTEHAIDHNMYVVKDLAYQSNYEAGLRILEIDEANFELDEKAFFSVWRPDDVSERPPVDFYGAWSNYPYFINGDDAYPEWLPVSSMDYGLYLVKPRYEQFQASTAVQKRSRNKTAGPVSCAHLVEKRECSAEPEC